MEIVAPSALNNKNIPTIIEFCNQIRNNNGVYINAENIGYMSPLAIAMLKTAIHSNSDCRVADIIWMDTNRASYLQRIDFFKDLDFPSLNIVNQVRHDRRANLVELKQLNNEFDAQDISNILAETIRLSIEAEGQESIVKNIENAENFDISNICDPIKYLVSEILLNATSHSKRNSHPRSKAWVVAQKNNNYRTGPTLEIAIVDDGCGILSSLAHVLTEDDERTHSGALLKAMQPYVSCNYGIDEFGQETTNQGVGLFVARDMLQEAGGSLTIITGDAIYDSDYEKTQKREQRCQISPSSWNGVAVSISIPCAGIYGVNPTNSLAKIKQTTDLVALTFS